MTDVKALGVVDDDQAVRESLTSILSAKGYRVEAFETADELLQASRANGYACLLVDLQMPGRTGLQLIEELDQGGALPPTIVLTGHGSISIAVQAMKLGARDFLEKPYSPDELMEAVERTIANAFADQSAPGSDFNLSELAPRQMDVLKGLVRGKPNKVIAHELGLSVRTVEHYRAALMSRMGARTLPDLLRRAISAGL